MQELRQNLFESLKNMQTELENSGLWELDSPPASHLASTEPFCVDTLNFTQWLQWVLIPRMREIIDAEAPLPPESGIHVLAQEALKDMEQDMRPLIAEIQAFDQLLSEAAIKN